jgi:hypothetical protein
MKNSKAVAKLTKVIGPSGKPKDPRQAELFE